MQAVQLNVADEVKALGDALALIILDIKQKKGVAQIVADSLPGLMAAIGGYSTLPADIKMIDNQVYLLKCVAGPFEAPAA